MWKRVVVVFGVIIVLFTGLFYRVGYLSSGEALAQVARNQSTYSLEVSGKRGMIYDCNFQPLVNNGVAYRAAILPGVETIPTMRRLFPNTEDFTQRLQSGCPFLVDVPADFEETAGVKVFEVTSRYGQQPAAVHLIGHLQDGIGVYGLEQAFDSYLSEIGEETEVRYQIDVTGHALAQEPEVVQTGAEDRRGIVLTLDARIQQIVEYSARKHLTKGAVVVLDCNTGDIKASVSLPEFDPKNVSDSFDMENSPFLNKAFSEFCVGSSFKLVVTAAALEQGIAPGSFECTGSIDVGGQTFHCNNRSGHGWVDLTRAVEVSCNPYFIHLAQQVGAEDLRNMAASFGFGRASVLADGYQTSSGNLPDLEELRNPADLANFGFGQGVLTATPLQIARMVSVFANGGILVSPRLVQGYSNQEGSALQQELPGYTANRIISEGTAHAVHDLMVSVVEEGSGRNARPEQGGAGGKTASAQTGRYYDEERTNEIVEAWFAGFFPANQPRYTIVVLAEGADSGSLYAAPVFKEIADGIIELEKGIGAEQGEIY